MKFMHKSLALANVQRQAEKIGQVKSEKGQGKSGNFNDYDFWKPWIFVN